MTPINPVSIAVTKPWWESRTLRLNMIAAALIALEAQFSLLQPFLPGNVYAWMAVALTVGNSVLRVVTASQLVLGKPAE